MEHAARLLMEQGCEIDIVFTSRLKRARDSLRTRRPPMTEDHPYYPGRERNHADLNKEQISLTVSLLDFMERTIPL
jgi:bisphosphoglycerate-dependent phosphoglycerate mutase